mmetsp:Transcript_18595/g.37654  ORF Transcript_18595/g.37654 Transcript_18595/m.37654 type:complete len:235 (-) Transcript_18595:2942-3646(-)
MCTRSFQSRISFATLRNSSSAPSASPPSSAIVIISSSRSSSRFTNSCTPSTLACTASRLASAGSTSSWPTFAFASSSKEDGSLVEMRCVALNSASSFSSCVSTRSTPLRRRKETCCWTRRLRETSVSFETSSTSSTSPEPPFSLSSWPSSPSRSVASLWSRRVLTSLVGATLERVASRRSTVSASAEFSSLREVWPSPNCSSLCITCTIICVESCIRSTETACGQIAVASGSCS